MAVWALPSAVARIQIAQKTSVQVQKDDDDKQEKAPPAGTQSKTPKSQRWPVSWAVAPDTAQIRSKATSTTIARLLQYKRPKELPGKGTIPVRYKTHRIRRVETTLWQVKGTVVNVAAEHDGDYRLIVADSRGHEVTCVLPDPALAPKRGRFSHQIDRCRAIVLKKFKPDFTPRNVRVPIEIVGIGYFGRFNSDANKSPEGFQLHPVTALRFR